jgi:excisionase family DNA binding protein
MNDDESGTAPDNDRLHDVETIARRLNVSSKTVRRRIDSGELACYRVGRLLRVSERQYQNYLAGVQRGHRP